MPVLIGPLVGLALGVALAIAWRREAMSDDAMLARTRLAVAALLGTLVFAPTCALFMLLAGDWALFYLVDVKAVPSAILLVVTMLDAALVAIGFEIGRRAARTRSPSALGTALIVPLIVAGMLCIAFASKLRVEGTAQQVAAGFGTRAVAGGPLGMSILWAWATLGLGGFVASRSLEVPHRAESKPGRRA